jgi:hypothetical protein
VTDRVNFAFDNISMSSTAGLRLDALSSFRHDGITKQISLDIYISNRESLSGFLLTNDPRIDGQDCSDGCLYRNLATVPRLGWEGNPCKLTTCLFEPPPPLICLSGTS